MNYERKVLASVVSRGRGQVLGILGLVAYQYGRTSLNAPLLLKTVAVYQITIAAIAVRTRIPQACTYGVPAVT